jgi:hypothetical protein
MIDEITVEIQAELKAEWPDKTIVFDSEYISRNTPVGFSTRKLNHHVVGPVETLMIKRFGPNGLFEEVKYTGPMVTAYKIRYKEEQHKVIIALLEKMRGLPEETII